MKWGLIPFWTKRNPDYATVLKTINCRDDSLATPGGMWSSMKGRKRCIVVAQGFYEWLKPGGPGSKEKIPHFVKRKDGKLMCFAGLWDCVQYEEEGQGNADRDGEGQKIYTYTIVTTDSNNQLKFLHDRMPVILDPGSDALLTWLDPKRYEWTMELQALLKPYAGELEVYPVSKEVGKVGNNSPNFIIPIASKENKRNIANFFAKGPAKKDESSAGAQLEVKNKDEAPPPKTKAKTEPIEKATKPTADSGTGDRWTRTKRQATGSPVTDESPAKKLATQSPARRATSASPTKPQGRGTISATRNEAKSPVKAKGKQAGTQKITKFFASRT
jgi:putative SOS response-associated peptidase YedK